jgi:NTP pyrophosphatase (non-canonical NTP hydrolase)
MSDFQREVGEWGNITFTEATTASMCAHLKREVIELDDAARRLRTFAPGYDPVQRRKDLAEEAADCLMLLLHIAHRNSIDLEEAARQKFEVNKRRQWGKPDADGVCEHIKP